MQTSSKISIALATYNGGLYLREQLDSIYNQTLIPDEVVVCDDCSTDGTVDILEEFHQKYGLIFYINERRTGFVKNFEKAIFFCTKDFIALSDQDDIWLPNKLEILSNTITKLQFDFADIPLLVHSDAFVINNNFRIIKKRFIGKIGEEKGINNMLFGRSKVQGAACIINRKMREVALPFPPNLYFHDIYLGFISETIGKRTYINKQLFYYRKHEQSITVIKDQKIWERIKGMISRDFYLISNIENECVELFFDNFNKMLNANDLRIMKTYFLIIDKNSSKWECLLNVFLFQFKGNRTMFNLILKLLLLKSEHSKVIDK